MKRICLFMVTVCLCSIVFAQGGPRNDPRWNNKPSPYPQDNRGYNGPKQPGPNKPGPNKPGPKQPGPNKPGPNPNFRPDSDHSHPGYQQPHRDRRDNGPNRPGSNPNYRPGHDNRQPNFDPHRPAPAPKPGHHDSKPNFGISIGPNGIGFSVDHGGHRPFSVDFWKSYNYNGPSWGYMTAGPRRPDSYWMGTTSWDNLRGFFPYRWDRPAPLGPQPRPNYQLAVHLAHVNRQLPPNYNPAQEQWLPLGTFVMVDDLGYTQDSTYYVQLAVNRDGYVSGSMFNSQTNQVLPVVGRIDPRTQVLAFSVQGWNEVFSTSVYDLTQNQARVLVMRGERDYQVDYMVRVQK